MAPRLELMSLGKVRSALRNPKSHDMEGIKTSIPLHQRIIADPDFRAGRFDTGFMERFVPTRAGA